MTLTNNGSLGIGTTNPLSTLSVGGDGDSGVSIYATGRAYGVSSRGTGVGVHS